MRNRDSDASRHHHNNNHSALFSSSVHATLIAIVRKANALTRRHKSLLDKSKYNTDHKGDKYSDKVL